MDRTTPSSGASRLRFALSESRTPHPYVAATLGFLCAWAIVLLVFGVRIQAIYALEGQPMAWGSAIAASAVDWLPWLAFAPFVAWLTARMGFASYRRAATLAVHAMSVLGLTTVHALVRPTLSGYVGLTGRNSFVVAFLMLVQFDLLVYAVIAGAMLAIRYAVALQKREHSAAAAELRAARLEQSLAESRLALLRTQLDPHFLFNTMHGVSTLMHEDPVAADAMLTSLGDLLRASMTDNAPHEVTLEEELDFSERYLGIQRARFGSRLRTAAHIQPAAMRARVPSMLLQPLLENAIRHGIAPRRGGGCLEVEARIDGRMLRVFVRDDGAGPPEHGGGAHGIGLRNTRLRLTQMYGDGASLELRRREPSGTEVAVAFPLRVGRNGIPDRNGRRGWAARLR
jgi:two-component system, LytTR family, sensor kinase